MKNNHFKKGSGGVYYPLKNKSANISNLIYLLHEINT